MSSAATAASSAHPARSPFLVFAPYVERFAQGRRVAVLGDATTGLAAELAARGARLVHVYDPDKARAEQAALTLATRGASFAAYSEGDLGVRDGAFDLTIVPDATLFSNATTLLARARALTSRQGVVLVATPNAERERSGAARFGYYELYDALSLQFAHVRMIGQVPFTGFALVDFSAEGDPEVAVDTSLAEASGPREPLYFVGLASGQPVDVDSYCVVELPTATMPMASEPTGVGASTLAALERERLVAAEARSERDRALAEIEAMRAAQKTSAAGPPAAAVQAAIERERREASVARRQLVEALSELEAMGEALRDAQQRAIDGEQLEAVRSVLEQERLAITQLSAHLEAARIEVETAREARKVAEARAHEATRRADELTRALTEARAVSARAPTETPEQRSRIDALARQLAEQQEHAARLTHALAKAEDDRRRAQLREQAMARTLAEREAQGRGVDPNEHEALRVQMQSLKTGAREHEALRSQSSALASRVRELEAELTRTREAAGLRARELEAAAARGHALETAAARARELETELTRARQAAAMQAREVEAARTREAEAHAAREAEAARAQALEAAIAQAKQVAVVDEEPARDLASAEQALRERAREVNELRHEIERRGSLVRELLAALEAAGALPEGAGAIGGGGGGEGDSSSSRHKAEAGPTGVGPQGGHAAEASHARDALGAPHASVALEAEIDALRRALLQERAARQRAEALSFSDANAPAVLQQQLDAGAG